MMNTFGRYFRLTTFGESHGVAVGGVIDGCPSRIVIDEDAISSALARRRGDRRFLSSERALEEKDEIEWLSGVTAKIETLGTPIAFLIRNTAQRSADYEALKDVYRPGHADYTYEAKYGIRDYRGGGRASARETVSRVVAGSIAKQILEAEGVSISATIIQVGQLTDFTDESLSQYLHDIKTRDDSVGGIVECTITDLPVGLGEPVFGKLQAQLAAAMMTIPAAKGFEYGMGFYAAEMLGTEHNKYDDGLLGGITTGSPITFRVAFKPTASIRIGGRHDVCVAMRAPVIIESMAAMVILDNMIGCAFYADRIKPTLRSAGLEV